MRVRYREIVETVEFDSFAEMFKFLFKEQGLVFCDGLLENRAVRVVCTHQDKQMHRNIYIASNPDGEEMSFEMMAEGIKDDCSNVDEEELSLLYELSAFIGEIRTVERD